MNTLVVAFVALLGVTAGFEDKTVVQYLADNGYNTLASLVVTAGLDTALSSNGPFTVFAPSDAAFAALGQTTLTNLQNNIGQLTAILKYHVINEYVLVPMVNSETKKTTLEGQELTLRPVSGSLQLNNDTRINAANNDIICNNGVVQPIDKVLMPPVLASLSISQLLLMDDARFKDLFLALLLADLTTVLDSGDFTLFAPIDSAFAVYKDNLLDPSNPNAKQVYQEVLKNHVIPGARMSNQLSNGQQLFTLHGTPINVTIASSGAMVNQANIIDVDIRATNGVIHAIDQILVPPGFGPSSSPSP